MPEEIFSEEKYENYRKKGLILITKYLSITPHPLGGGSGWAGYDRSEQDGGLRVFTKHGKVFSTWIAQYNGEAFIRFPHTHMTYGQRTGYAIRRFIVAHYPHLQDGMTEELIYFRPQPNQVKQLEALFNKYDINPLNAHEYVIRISRGDWGLGPYKMEVYFHDERLPPIPEVCCDRKTIYEELTKNDVKWLFHPPRAEVNKTNEYLFTDRIRSVAEMLKTDIIPRNRFRPTRQEYVEWFKTFAGLNNEIAVDVYEIRGQFRLP